MTSARRWQDGVKDGAITNRSLMSYGHCGVSELCALFCAWAGDGSEMPLSRDTRSRVWCCDTVVATGRRAWKATHICPITVWVHGVSYADDILHIPVLIDAVQPDKLRAG